MKFSAKALYGLRASFVLGQNFGKVALSVSRLSALAGVSPAYLEKIMHTLKKDGIVTSQMGSSGGYVLSRPPPQISIGEILTSLEGDLFLSSCVANDCKSKNCPNKNIFEIIYFSINDVLSRLTLQQMMDEYINGNKNQKSPTEVSSRATGRIPIKEKKL
ncbi:MAG: Rrf2 family transcriptional regulator [Christensenellaceae bacterium]|nr:Rrf2 family transcriptional regulator [Christensenellaceae bacterium]